MIQTDNKSLCCGCETCGLVCPKNCISFEKDALGHKYPHVDKSVCINCKKCENVCPIQKEFAESNIGLEAWVAYSTDRKIRARGSSGGIFETVASWIIDDGGIVFASKFDENLKLKCVEAKTIDEIKFLTKSKYLQSDCSSAFPIMKRYVEDGKKMLFVSTPCQIAAFKSYLGNFANKENVYLMDFFCHGVPSQDFFDRCRIYVEQKKRISIKNYEFRSKINNGKTPHYYTMTYEKNGKEKKKTQLYFFDPFYFAFQKYISLRDCCYICPYAKGNHAGDLTIGDFHEIERYIHGINRFEGVSTVLINNEKGFSVWKNVKNGLNVHNIDIQMLQRDKQIYSGGSKEPQNRKSFLVDLQSGMDFNSIIKKWFNGNKEYKKRIYYRLPDVLRKILKKTIGM